MSRKSRIDEALDILKALGMPREQQNERTALCLLALLNLTKTRKWAEIESPLVGITPMMEFAKKHYQRDYAPNTRETFRRYSTHQLCQAGLVVYNPDNLTRPTNSPKAVYQIEPAALSLLKSYGQPEWAIKLSAYLASRETLAGRYAMKRNMTLIPVTLATGAKITLSPGEHNKLIKVIVEEFAPRFIPGCVLIYIGDTGSKWGYYNRPLLLSIGVAVDEHGKMPDAVFHDPSKNWLILVESVTSHGPINSKRHEELRLLFKDSSAKLVFVTAFPNRSVLARYLVSIAWETNVWVADNPTHMIHFNGSRFLGPY